MEEKNKKRQIAKISVFITSIFVIFMSVTYAFINQILTGTKEVVVSAGVLDLVLEEENAITISDALPMHDEVGMIQEDAFVFRLVNKTSNPTNYTLKLSKIESNNELNPFYVKYYLTKNGNGIGDPNFIYNLPSGGEIDTGIITGGATIEYTLRFWIISSIKNQSYITGKSLSYKLNAQAVQKVSTVPAKNTNEIIDSSISDYCRTYNDGIDTFLVGRCPNNYVWYSGKLWRAVLQNNETGAVKMVTDNAITAIAYNDLDNTVFENSYIDQWLSQEFLPTLHDYEDYLVVDSVWDATENSSNTPIRPTYTTNVTRTVGLLNSYEHYTTYNNSYNLASASTGYLNNGISWWLMTPYNSSNINYVATNGNLGNYYSPYAHGIRPSVNLKSGIQISKGSGTQSNPYILEGDIKEPATGITLLSTKYSGDYITFNDELYRIVDIENELTKITAVDKSSGLSKKSFHSQSDVISFADASIKTDLENYYQELRTTNELAYNMIEPNTIWYLGTLAKGTSYKASICASVDANISMNSCKTKTSSTLANIGLPRVGEMFTSQITRGKKSDFWTLTPYDTFGVHLVRNVGAVDAIYSVYKYDIRPSMYLKSEVKIASDNTGNGTYEHPYKIELGA